MKNLLALITLSAVIQLGGCNSTPGESSYGLFSKENLMAWCIVPFDACERNPEQRATMLNELGMLRDVAASGYRGPIGIIGHTEGEDIRVVLQRNLKGLRKLTSQL